MKKEKTVGTLDLTPSWVETARVCTVLLVSGSADGQKEATKTLEQMGELADRYVKLMRACQPHIDDNLDEHYLTKGSMLTPDGLVNIYRLVRNNLKNLKL